MDRPFTLESISVDRPVIARLLIGTIVATASVMAIGVYWAAAGSSVGSTMIAAVGMLIAASMVMATSLPIECTVGAGITRSIPWRLQNRRLATDFLAVALAMLVVTNLVTTPI